MAVETKSSGRILIVDDMPVWRTILPDILGEQYEVTTSSNYDEARQMLSTDSFDVAIIDIRLEDGDRFNVDGLKLLKYIKETQPRTGVIILTGYADSFRHEIVLKYNADELYLKVPPGGMFDIDDFSSTVAHLVAKHRGRVLIVDDMATWREMLADILLDSHDVLSVSNYEEALNLIATEDFDVAILDVRLEDKDDFNVDGLKLLKEIKEKKPTTGVIILTGYSHSIRQEIIIKYEADALCLKVPPGGTFNISEFQTTVQQLISKYQRGDEGDAPH